MMRAATEFALGVTKELQIVCGLCLVNCYLLHGNIYRTRAIISRGLYTFYPLFEVHLGMYCDLWPYVWLVSIQEWFLIKSEL